MVHSNSFIYSASSHPDHSPVYRNKVTRETGELYEKLSNGATTIYESVQLSIKENGPELCFGSRKVVGIIQEDKEVEKKIDGKIVKETKKWKYFKLSPYEWVTYDDLGQQLDDIGSAMKYINLGGDRRLAIFSPTSRYWSTMANACYTQSICAVTVYDTLGADGLKHGLIECDVTAIFITPDQIGTLIKILPHTPKLTHIILTESLDEKKFNSVKEIRSDMEMYSFDEFISLGKEHPAEHNPPKPDDVCLIMYTSGTTGNPKGVIITHRNVASIVAGAEFLTDSVVDKNTELYLSFLPLAHILAFAVDCFFISKGVRIAYGSPRTLTSDSVRECNGDLREAKPTLLIGVPQIYEMIRKSILTRVNKSGTVAKTVFETSLAIKSFITSIGLPSFIIDALIFSKVKYQMGGNLRYALSGGAPLSEESQKFFSNSVCELLQGYGLTEVCGLAFACTPEISRPNSIGMPSPALEFKLVDVPDVGYFHSNDPPQGELWVRGPAVTKGYFKNNQASEEAFTEDGWFKTGDIVTYQDDGTLSIIDRKKNLAKLANGEYVALERLEAQYKNVLYVQNICVVVNSEKSRPVALVQANLAEANNYAQSAGLDKFFSLSDLTESEQMHDLILNTIQSEGKRGGFNTSETIIDLYLTPEEWSPDNDLLTTSQKLKRKNISEKYKDALDTMYRKF